jgi:hypothetical protein
MLYICTYVENSSPPAPIGKGENPESKKGKMRRKREAEGQ